MGSSEVACEDGRVEELVSPSTEAEGGEEAADGLIPGKRARCQRCARSVKVCLCKALPPGAPLDSRSRIVLLIHPKEVQRALGTAPLLQLCLRNLIIKEGDRFPEPEEDPEFHAAIHEGGRKCYLVCPGPGAEELHPPALSGLDAAGLEADRQATLNGDAAAADPDEADDLASEPRTLIFIDGRWPQAKSMVNRSVWLRESIGRVVLMPTEQSGYVFRKQPEEGCLSTLEAVGEALLALEGRRGPALKAALLEPFRLMVDMQCAFIPEVVNKNKRLEEHGRRRQTAEACAFDPEAAADIADAAWPVQWREEERDAPHGNGTIRVPDVHCICTWGQKAASGRQVVVVQILRAPLDVVKKLATDLSNGRSRGQRFWILPPFKVPEGARYEAMDPETPELRRLLGSSPPLPGAAPAAAAE